MLLESDEIIIVTYFFIFLRNTALWSDANLKVSCEEPFTQAVFKRDTKMKKYQPFSGTFTCELGEAMSGEYENLHENFCDFVFIYGRK